MAWQTPRTNWTAADGVTDADLNRIEGNIAVLRNADGILLIDTEGHFVAENVEAALHELYTNTVDGKTTVANAITAMGQTASGSDSYDTLANKIRAISTDADAAEGDVLSDKTFYQGGVKRTGTMPNRGAVVITPSTTNQVIAAGYHNGSGYVKGDANLIASNIKLGVTIFGVTGTVKEGDYKIGDYISTDKLGLTKPAIVGRFTGHTSTVRSVSAHPTDGGCFSGSEDKTVRKINSSGVQEWSFTGHTDTVYGVSAHPTDGGCFTSSGLYDKTVRKINSSGAQVWSFTGHINTVYSVSAHPTDGGCFSGSRDRTVCKINSSGAQVWSFTGHTDTVYDVSAHPTDGGCFSGSGDKTVRKINSSGVQEWSFTGHIWAVYGVSAHPTDGGCFSGSEDETVRKINSSGVQEWSFTGHTNIVYGVSAHPTDGGCFSGSTDHTVRKINSSGVQEWVYSNDSSIYSVSAIPGSNISGCFAGFATSGFFTVTKFIDKLKITG